LPACTTIAILKYTKTLVMKNIIALALLCLFAGSAGAQKIIEKQVELNANAIIRLNIQIADSVKVITWNKNTAYIKASVEINSNKNNDDYNFTFEGSGSSFDVKSKFSSTYKGCCGNCNCNCHCHDSINVVVYVPENTDVVIETINGNITVAGKLSSIKAKSISGFVDVAVAPQLKADVRLSTITGTMYSDLDLKVEDKSINHVGGNKLFKALNGGGKPFELETISGDIYLRKG
jgi:DUF4097 and DUF4098 domain-containing protein YvlB